MINLENETVLPLQQAAKRIPSNRDGKATHISTLMRWIQKGVRGVRLEATRPGGRWVTSAEALQRFADRLATAKAAGPVPREHRACVADDKRIDDELDKLGL